MTGPAQYCVLWMLDGRNQLSDEDMVGLWHLLNRHKPSTPAAEVTAARQALTTAGYLEPVGRHASTGPLWRLTYKGTAKLRKLKEEA